MFSKSIFVLSFMATFCLSATEVSFYVSKDKTAGKAAAAKGGGKWLKNLSKAFAKAANTLNEGKEVSVVIKVTAGDYKGDLGSGAYQMPLYDNPKGTLTILGGFNADFSVRKPFHTPSKIVTIKQRSSTLLSFTKKSKRNGILDRETYIFLQFSVFFSFSDVK